MKRVIYSIYIDIPTEDLDAQPPHHGDTEDKNQKAKREFAYHLIWLEYRQRMYAKSIGIEYKLFTADNQWIEYRDQLAKQYPQLTMYNIVNFYKIHLMYQLKEEYDEMLYMDLDVVPVTSESFFDAWDLSKGMVIRHTTPMVEIRIEDIKRREKSFIKKGRTDSIRSPAAKYWNNKALLMEHGINDADATVFNTGIVGINKQSLEELDYFADFDYIIEVMTDLKEEQPSMWPTYIQHMFGWDNETIWGFYCVKKNLQIQTIDSNWHYFLDKGKFIPKSSKFIHVIHKDFYSVREWCEKNNL
jgi:hypothetical protein